MSREDLDDLEPDELVSLAMMAFIHMYDNHTIGKEELLTNIIDWFHVMTDDIEGVSATFIHPIDEGLH